MVRYISLVKRGYELPRVRLVSLGAFASRDDGVDCDEEADIFNDMTSNFEDLGYWNSERDLDGHSAPAVTVKIEEVISKLRLEGVQPWIMTKEDEDSFTIPNWMWGHKSCKSGQIQSYDLPESDRKRVLMFHLENLLDTARSHDDAYYFHLQKP